MQQFQAEDLKFALKVAIAVFVTSIWGFLPGTKDWYANWRGKFTNSLILQESGPQLLPISLCHLH